MNVKNKAKYRSAHEPEIMLYEAATRELRMLLGGKPVPSEKKTWARIEELSAAFSKTVPRDHSKRKKSRSWDNPGFLPPY